jgi:DNA-binding GntR family transcriptional regulator
MIRNLAAGISQPHSSLESEGIERDLRRMIITGELAPGSFVTQAHLGE